MTKESTDLIVLEKLTPAVIFKPGGVDAILEKIKAEVRHTPVDISTKTGREHVASIAYKVARSKTALDKMGKDLGQEHYDAWKKITAERSKIEKELDALKDEVRKPLTDWENAEKDRIAGHEAAIAEIERSASFLVSDPGTTEIVGRMHYLEELATKERDWKEFGRRAADAIEASLTTLKAMFAAAEKREAEAAELARLRAEEIARQQKERDDKIAAEAAERARVAAEQKAAREAEEAARAAQAELDRIEREKAEALAKAERDAKEAADAAERARLEAEQKAAKAAQEAAAKAEAERLAVEREKAAAVARAEKAEADRKAAAAKAEQDAKDAAEAAEKRQAAAIEAERKRVADEQAKVAAETAAREADKAHRAKINREAMAVIGKIVTDQTIARLVIEAIARGNVPHVKIEY